MSASTDSMASLVECPLCLEPFTDPRMLTTCCHTFCYTCLDDHLKHSGHKGQFQCPVCRKLVLIPEHGADAFPKNFYVNKCLDLVRSSKNKADKAADGEPVQLRNGCSNSEEDDPCDLPRSFCLKCCESYCTPCSKAHARSKASRSHDQVPLADLTKKMFMDAVSRAETPRCPKHNKKLKLFCKTCKDAVCSVCRHISHESHSFQELNELDADLQTELGDILNSVESLIGSGEEATAETNRYQQQIEHTMSGVRETMDKVSETIQQILDSETRDIQKKLTQKKEYNKTQIEVRNKNLSLKQEGLESFHQFVKALQARGSVHNKLSSLPEVRRQLEEFQSSSQDEDACCMELINTFDFLAREFNGQKHKIMLGDPGSGWVFQFKYTVEHEDVPGPRAAATATQDGKDGRKKLKACHPQVKPAREVEPPQGLNPRPKVRMVTYGDASTNQAAQMVKNELQLDGKMVAFEKQLEPLPTDRPQVDVLCPREDEIHSVVEDFKLDIKRLAKRNLVLWYKTYGGSLEETRSVLGQHAGLFKCIIWSSLWDHKTFIAAMTRLADYLRQVAGIDARCKTPDANVPSSHNPRKRPVPNLPGPAKDAIPYTSKPKVRMVTYGIGSTNVAAQMVNNDLQLDGKMVAFEKQLEPLATDRPQVDVICCTDENAQSIVTQFGLDQQTAEERNLVLCCKTYGTSLEETRNALGQQARLFKCVIWSSLWDLNSSTTAMTTLAKFLRRVARGDEKPMSDITPRPTQIMKSRHSLETSSTASKESTSQRQPAREPMVIREQALKKRLWALYKAVYKYQVDGRRLINIFITLPSIKDYPSYYRVIREPIDMTIIRSKIEQDKYANEQEMVSDFELMFSNARFYNEEGCYIHKDADQLERVMRSKMRSFLDTSQANKKQKNNQMASIGMLSQKLEGLYDAIRDCTDANGRTLATPFMKLPLKYECPDYYDVIKEPIDMQRVFQRMMTGQYCSLEDMVSDCMLMFDNARRYNKPGSLIYKDAMTLQIVCLEKKQQLSVEDHKEGIVPTKRMKRGGNGGHC